MNKREFVTRTAALTLTALAANAMAQQDPHAHHHGTSGPNAALLAATSDCLV